MRSRGNVSKHQSYLMTRTSIVPIATIIHVSQSACFAPAASVFRRLTQSPRSCVIPAMQSITCVASIRPSSPCPQKTCRGSAHPVTTRRLRRKRRPQLARPKQCHLRLHLYLKTRRLWARTLRQYQPCGSEIFRVLGRIQKL